MNSFDLFINFFKQGGAFLYPIAAVWAIGLAIAVERLIFLSRVASGNKRLWAKLAPLLQSGNISKAMQVAEGTDSALSTIMRYGLSRMSTARRRDDIDDEMVRHIERMKSFGWYCELMRRWSCPSNSSREYLEISQNLSLAYVITPRWSVAATIADWSSASRSSSS